MGMRRVHAAPDVWSRAYCGAQLDSHLMFQELRPHNMGMICQVCEPWILLAQMGQKKIWMGMP
jgi:hypothetical protein